MTDTVRVRELAEVNPSVPEFESLPADSDVTFVPLEAVWPASRLDLSRARPKSEVSTGYVRFRDGDVLVPKVTPTFQAARSALAVGVPTTVGAASTEVHIVRPRPGNDPRYVTYGFHTEQFLGEGVSAFQGVAGLQRVPDLFLRDFRIRRRSLEEQRQIADFLDDQVARIDEIVRLREEQIGSLRMRLQTLVDQDFQSEETDPKASLLLRVTPGYAFPSEGFSHDAEDVRLLRGVNVGVGELNWEDSVHWAAPTASLKPFNLHAGDVVMGMDRPWIRGGMRIAKVAAEDLPALLLQRVALLRPGPSLEVDYMYWAYRATAFRLAVESELTGLSVPHLSAEQICSYRIPLLDQAAQTMIGMKMNRAAQSTASLESEMQAHIDLMQERKRSLTTAAVTGEFDVTTASGRGVA
ncbi:hypothetical protein [Flexivirga meconopsidis]|uniref:hypothetical protein n=1 Tax=Flexivirga meconopsidis TaxID=2977121 RepID=UPI00223F8046|nr:hypothetical protein [Flexivirga meconopsidis]